MICHLDGCFPVFLIQPFCKLKRIETIWACGTGWPKPPKHWISQEHLSSKWFLLMWKVTPGTAQLMPRQSIVIKSRMSHLQMPDMGQELSCLERMCMISVWSNFLALLYLHGMYLQNGQNTPPTITHLLRRWAYRICLIRGLCTYFIAVNVVQETWDKTCCVLWTLFI